MGIVVRERGELTVSGQGRDYISHHAPRLRRADGRNPLAAELRRLRESEGKFQQERAPRYLPAVFIGLSLGGVHWSGARAAH